jgi:PAS domain S-box-containing protein
MESSSSPFSAGSSELRALIRSHDWRESHLGEPANWPQSLKTLVGFALDSKFPMFLAWGEELTFLYNDAYSEILGKRHPWALGRPFQEIWSDIWDDIFPLIQRALAGESVFLENLPLTMYRKGYEEATWFTFTYSPVRDETGVVRGMSCTCIETTHQVRAERQRTAEIHRLQDLFQQTPGFMALVTGPEHVYELTNLTYLQLLGHRSAIGKRVREVLPELEGQGYFEIFDRVFESGEPFIGKEMPVKLQRQPNAPLEERIVDFIIQPVKDSTGKVTALFIQGSDVTEAVKAKQALNESEKRLRQLANTIPHLTWMANPDGTIHWYNDRWYEFTGLSEEEIGQWKWEDIIDPPYLRSIMERWGTSVATGVPYEFTGPVRSAKGEYRTFYMRADPLRDANGNIVQWFGINIDVTEIHKAQESLIAANRRKDDFLAMLAHELRNPLAPINTAAELLKLPTLDQARIQKTSEIITRQVSHMRELVDDLLDVSRVTRGLITLQEEVLDLKTMVSEAVEQVQGLIDAKKQLLTTHAPDEAICVKGDRTRLTQVLTNILNNAAKYTPESGAITVKLNAYPDQAEVTICDTGIGISPELLPHVFELFTQGERSADRSQGGLGLGLALVKSLVELHGGTVTVTSRGIGQGSEFSIRLPKLEETSKEYDKQGEHYDAVSSSTSSRILVVDDNVDAAETLAMLLETLGHIVSTEHSAQQALERARREAPKMVFLDIGLPEMTGHEVASRLRAMPEMANATLVAVTGYGQPEDKEQALKAGFDHHLVKPVNLDSILALIR